MKTIQHIMLSPWLYNGLVENVKFSLAPAKSPSRKPSDADLILTECRILGACLRADYLSTELFCFRQGSDILWAGLHVDIDLF